MSRSGSFLRFGVVPEREVRALGSSCSKESLKIKDYLASFRHFRYSCRLVSSLGLEVLVGLFLRSGIERRASRGSSRSDNRTFMPAEVLRAALRTLLDVVSQWLCFSILRRMLTRRGGPRRRDGPHP